MIELSFIGGLIGALVLFLFAYRFLTGKNPRDLFRRKPKGSSDGSYRDRPGGDQER